MSQLLSDNSHKESVERTDQLVQEIKQLAMGIDKTIESNDHFEQPEKPRIITETTSSTSNYNTANFAQPESRTEKPTVSEDEHRALIEKIKAEFKKPPLNPNPSVSTLTSPVSVSSTTVNNPNVNIASFTKDLDTLHTKVDEILRKTPVAQKRDKEANELYSSAIGQLHERKNSASQLMTVSFNPNSNIGFTNLPKTDYNAPISYGEASSTFATPIKETPQNNQNTSQNNPISQSTLFSTNQANPITQSTVFNNTQTSYNPTGTNHLSTLNKPPSTLNSQYLGVSNYPYSTYSYQPSTTYQPTSTYQPSYQTSTYQAPTNYQPTSTYQQASTYQPSSTGTLQRERSYAFDKDKLDQIIKGINSRGPGGSVHNTSNHQLDRDRDRSERDLKTSHAGSEFNDWRKNHLKGEFSSDAPFPTFTENYRQQGAYTNFNNQPYGFDKASPKFSLDSRGYEQPPLYEPKRGSHSERNDYESQTQSKRDSVQKQNANDFFRNLESGKAVIKMVSKEKTSARNEDVNYNCGELENDDDSLILGFLNTKLKDLAQEDPYYTGTLQDDDDDEPQKNVVETVAGGSKKKPARGDRNNGTLKESEIVDYEEFARGLAKNDPKPKQQAGKFLDDDEHFDDFEFERNRVGQLNDAQRHPGHKRSDNMESDKYVQKTEQIRNQYDKRRY